MKKYTCASLVKRAGGDWKEAFRSETLVDLKVTITPEDATEILQRKRNNREIYNAHANKLLRAMLSTKFNPENPQCVICFDQKGQVADGVHRLTSQVKANKTYTWRVALGLSEDLVNLLDDGRVRTLADRFQAFTRSKLVREVTEGKAWRSRQAAATVNALYIAIAGEKNPSVDDAIAILRYYRESVVWVLETGGRDKMLRRAAFMAAATLAHYWAGQNYADGIMEETMEGLKTGEMIQGPVLVFRNYLQNTMSQGPKKAKITDSQWTIFMKSLRAFQRILTGEPFQKMNAVTKPTQLREWFFGKSVEQHLKHLKLAPLKRYLKELEGWASEGQES